MTTTTKTADFMGRALVTPDTDARDYVNRPTIADDRDYMGRSLTGGSEDPAQALLDEAAVRFDFSQYDDIDNMVDVNGGWGPASKLNTTSVPVFVSDGLELTTNGVDPGGWNLEVGLVDPVAGPLIFGPDGLTLVQVVRLGGDLEPDVARLSLKIPLLQANTLGMEGTGYPQGTSTWPVGGEFTATFYDMEPSEDTIVDVYEDFTPFEAIDAGVYLSVVILDVVGAEVRARLVTPNTDQVFIQPFAKAVPDYVADPLNVDDMVFRTTIQQITDPVVVSWVKVEDLGWNRALTAGEVDALVAHFTA